MTTYFANMLDTTDIIHRGVSDLGGPSSATISLLSQCWCKSWPISSISYFQLNCASKHALLKKKKKKKCEQKHRQSSARLVLILH